MNLEKLHFTVESLTDFEDGVHLIILLGMVGKFFVPLHTYYTTPQDSTEKIHNVKKAFELMQELGLDLTNCLPEGEFKKLLFSL
jgi:parvin